MFAEKPENRLGAAQVILYIEEVLKFRMNDAVIDYCLFRVWEKSNETILYSLKKQFYKSFTDTKGWSMYI